MNQWKSAPERPFDFSFCSFQARMCVTTARGRFFIFFLHSLRALSTLDICTAFVATWYLHFPSAAAETELRVEASVPVAFQSPQDRERDSPFP